jgi:tetratricopeptide (TPR) repeat protein/nitrate/TMAO reductase-like tetraheme cytochrome c subunit
MSRYVAAFSLTMLFLAGAAAFQPDRTRWPGRAPDASPSRAYVGSAVCRTCHEANYTAWRSTRHSFSVLTRDEARRAGYQLPPVEKTAPALRGWDDVLFTIGGRKRVAYVDRHGNVQGISFHPRTGGWSPFPAKPMQCGPCHHTGFDAAAANPLAAGIHGSWAELNIGCEACHGPGSRHVESSDKADITIDVSNRLCGTCHTTAGRVLPRDDDFHATHDDVQTWNRDAHVSGTQFYSFDAFCARCHSPYNGQFLDNERGATTNVFSEAKNGVTCISCHNPHALTNPVYRHDKAHLQAPKPPRSHIFKGHDGDVTTDDFIELGRRDEVCVQCHSGADRVELEHANATCSDCHNTFRHNTTAERRTVADVNRPALSCRPCHDDADHLLTILYRDPDALQAKYIHNLASLPETFRAKHGFRYIARARPRTSPEPFSALRLPSDYANASNTTSPEILLRKIGTRRAPSSRVAGGSAFLRTDLHRRWASDPAIGERQRAVLAAPNSIEACVDLAAVYAERGHADASVDVLDRILRESSSATVERLAPRLLLRSSPVVVPIARPAAMLQAVVDRLDSVAASRGKRELGVWLQGYASLARGDFSAAAKAFDNAVRIRPTEASLRFFQALSWVAEGKLDEAAESLRSIRKTDPPYTAARTVLGLVFIKKRQFATAERELRPLIDEDVSSAAPTYVMAIGYIQQNALASAVGALRLCIDRDSSYVAAYFELARAYRLLGSPEESIIVYRELIRIRPDDSEARWQLGSVFKYLSDAASFQIETLRDSPSTSSIGVTRQDVLESLARRASGYRDLAVSEFEATLRLRPAYLPAIRQIAESRRRAGRLREARALFEWLTRTQPDEWVYHYRLGTTLIETGEFDRAITALDRAVNLDPSQADCYLALGLADVRSGRLDQAIASFEKAVVYQPFNPALFTNLGAAYASRGAYEAARKHLRRALELGTFPLPRRWLTYTNLGLIELNEGHREAAIRAFRNALYLGPDNPRARDLLAKAQSDKQNVSTRREPFLFNDLLEIFGEVTTVVFDHE